MKRPLPSYLSIFNGRSLGAKTKLLLINKLMHRHGVFLQATARDEGYVLQVAILTSLVLIIGIAAFASRTSSGLFGAIDQSLNSEARDVAESAITDFQNALNREENRYLLAKIDTNWSSNDFNPCLSAVDSSTGQITAVPDSSKRPTAVTLTRYSPSANFKDLAGGVSASSARQFRVEKVEYFDSQRQPLALESQDVLVSGGTRALLRVTVVGKVEKNGSQSLSRVAREFEVVPKCCGRSFGMNTYGGVNWGRDKTACTISESNSTGNGIIGSLDGGGARGSSNQLDIRDQNSRLISSAICWKSNPPNPPSPNPPIESDLTGTPNPDCLNNQLRIGASGQSTGISFVPTEFPLTIPDWPATSTGTNSDNSPLPSPSVSTKNTSDMTGNKTYYVRLKMSTTAPFKPVGLEKCELRGTSLSSCTSLVSSGDPCSYKAIAYPWPVSNQATGGIPYYEASCRLKNIDSGSNTTIIFDTSNAKINLHFDDTAYTGEYMGGSGRTTIKRVHCRRDSAILSIPPDSNNVCQNEVDWNAFQASCPNLTDPSGAGSLSCSIDYNMSELLNIYALGAGSFSLNGAASVVGFNLIAPRADVELKGGGSADPNFMGRIWADQIYFNGNVKIRTLSTNPAFCRNAGGGGTESCPPTGVSILFDFIARSFSHASGF